MDDVRRRSRRGTLLVCGAVLGAVLSGIVGASIALALDGRGSDHASTAPVPARVLADITSASPGLPSRPSDARGETMRERQLLQYLFDVTSFSKGRYLSDLLESTPSCRYWLRASGGAEPAAATGIARVCFRGRATTPYTSASLTFS